MRRTNTQIQRSCRILNSASWFKILQSPQKLFEGSLFCANRTCIGCFVVLSLPLLSKNWSSINKCVKNVLIKWRTRKRTKNCALVSSASVSLKTSFNVEFTRRISEHHFVAILFWRHFVLTSSYFEVILFCRNLILTSHNLLHLLSFVKRLEKFTSVHHLLLWWWWWWRWRRRRRRWWYFQQLPEQRSPNDILACTFTENIQDMCSTHTHIFFFLPLSSLFHLFPISLSLMLYCPTSLVTCLKSSQQSVIEECDSRNSKSSKIWPPTKLDPTKLVQLKEGERERIIGQAGVGQGAQVVTVQALVLTHFREPRHSAFVQNWAQLSDGHFSHVPLDLREPLLWFRTDICKQYVVR